MEKLLAVAKTIIPSPMLELCWLAQRRNAINFAEGFPDFSAPSPIKKSAVSAINSDFNQYRTQHFPCNDIAICCGQTEAFESAIFATIDPGDEVILFDPSYETYDGCITLAGGSSKGQRAVLVALDPPHWSLDPQKLITSCTSKTKAMAVNSPQNPTGKVFTRAELEIIAKVRCTSDLLAITDEVYEHLTFDAEKHISLASLPGMQKRTIITSSLSKTYSWRIGSAIAASHFASAITNFHIRITDSAPAPFKEAALTALRCPSEHYETLRADYKSKRDYMLKLLGGLGFQIEHKPQGSFF
ncbi:Aminotransferase, class I/classII, partial [Dillenia turbinata]